MVREEAWRLLDAEELTTGNPLCTPTQERFARQMDEIFAAPGVDDALATKIAQAIVTARRIKGVRS